MKGRRLGFAIVAAFVAASCGASSPDTLVQQDDPASTARSIDTINDAASARQPAVRQATTTIATTTPTTPTTTPTTTATTATTTTTTTTATTTTTGVTTTTAAPDADPVRCIVRLHGKGDNGRDTSIFANGIRNVMPTGNEDGWGGRQWIYFPNDRYLETRGIVARAIAAEGCNVVVINGFSNGGAFAAALFCRGETFGGVVRGYVIDDPVTDAATAGCAPAANVDVVMYWTTAIAQPAGTDCADVELPCAGGFIVELGTYASRMGTSVTPSPYTDHRWYWDAPEILSFLE